MADDRIRKLKNQVVLSGYIAELTPYNELENKIDKNGQPYLSISGRIMCFEDSKHSIFFKSYIKSKKSDGSDSANFKKVKEWCKNCKTYADYQEEATKATLIGSLVDNSYVNKNGILKADPVINIQFFNDFVCQDNKDGDFKAEIDLESYINSVVEEVDGEKMPTGRKIYNVVSRDFFGNTLELKLPTEEEAAQVFEDYNLVKGATATMLIDITLKNKATQVESNSMGVLGGRARGIQGNAAPKVEYSLVNIIPIPEDKQEELSLDPELIKVLLNERKAKLQGLTAQATPLEMPAVDNNDMPF